MEMRMNRGRDFGICQLRVSLCMPLALCDKESLVCWVLHHMRHDRYICIDDMKTYNQCVQSKGLLLTMLSSCSSSPYVHWTQVDRANICIGLMWVLDGTHNTHSHNVQGRIRGCRQQNHHSDEAGSLKTHHVATGCSVVSDHSWLI